jgi:HSP20 family protein
MFGLSTKRKTDRIHEGDLMERPLAGLAELRQEFDSLFERFWSDFPRLSTAWEGFERFHGFEWEDEEDHYVLRAEAPGFNPEEFDVQIRGSQLVLSAEHKEEKKEKQSHGRFTGRLYESIMLPPGVLADQVEAKYRNGVLEIHLPKSPEARTQRITVKAE